MTAVWVLNLFLCCSLSVAVLSIRRPLFRAARDAEKTGRYIVTLKEDIDHEMYQRTLRQAVSLSNNKRAYAPIETVEKAFTLELNAVSLELIRKWPIVKHVEEEQMVFGSQDPTIPWHLDRIDQANASRDWQYSPYNNGEGIDVYVLDTGINYDHVQFEHRARYGGFDPVDDYYNETPLRKGRDCQGHGTHVASLVGSKTFGSANQVNLYSIRVLDCTNYAPWSVVLEGMDYLAKIIKQKKRPMVVVMSLGGPYQASANEAVRVLHSLGAVVVVAAGNGNIDSCRQSPSSSEYAITVGGTNATDGLYSRGPGTNYGNCVDIFAPGESVLGANFSCSNCTMVLSGTSMATPIVAGVAAMYLHDQPLLSPDDVKNKLLNNSIKDKINFSFFSDEAKESTSNILLQTGGGCGGTYVYRSHFNISSPGYPNEYPPSLLCEWRILGEPEQEIEFTLLDFDLEREYDYLLICDGGTCQYDNIKATFTGNMAGNQTSSEQRTIRSSSNSLAIILHADSNGGGRGFLGTFTKHYKGTPLIVKDDGEYLSSRTSHAHKPAHVQSVIGVRALDAVEVVSNWNSQGYRMSWVDIHRDNKEGAWLYNFLFHNSTVEMTNGYVELNSTGLREVTKMEEQKGLIAEIVTARLPNKGKDHLYGVVFKKRSHILESHTITSINLYESVLTRARLTEAGWTMVCQHFLYDDRIKVTAVFHRDKRRRYGITTGIKAMPKTRVYFGFDFFQFTSITLALGIQDFYPRYVSAYYTKDETEARLSVIYEQRDPDSTFYNWFRWGLDAGKVGRDIAYFGDSFSPVLLSSYVYSNRVEYMVVWGIKIQ